MCLSRWVLTSVTGVSGSGKSTLVDIRPRCWPNRFNGARQVLGWHTRRRLDYPCWCGWNHRRSAHTAINPATYTCVRQDPHRSPPPSRPRSAAIKLGRFSFNVKGAVAARPAPATANSSRRDELPARRTCRARPPPGPGTTAKPSEVHFHIQDCLEVLTCPSRKRRSSSSDRRRRPSPSTHRPGPRLPTSLRPRCPARPSGPRSRAPTGRTAPHPRTSRRRGLHFDDIRKLLNVINSLVDNTVIVIEHNLT